MGYEGLMTANGRLTVPLGDWTAAGGGASPTACWK
nr:hypothetical protein [Myxococcus sp. AB025B]